ncbi:MAG: MBL fold metallo-hydrolase [Candidatus Delongbacteria bacterium]
MKVSVLSSGSGGNSTLIQSDKSAILIDAGISGKRIMERLDSLCADAASISGLVITHDHSDHINGAGVIARKLKIPIYIHKENLENVSHKFEKCEIRLISDRFSIEEFDILPFPISHDGTANYAYNIFSRGKKISHLTDIGIVTTLVRQRIADSDLMVLESNHDTEMLKNGPYPWYLKQRISGNRGHLSNISASGLIRDTVPKKLKNLILAHLSKENNDPSLAYDNMTRTKEDLRLDFKLHTAFQDAATELVEV